MHRTIQETIMTTPIWWLLHQWEMGMCKGRDTGCRPSYLHVTHYA